MSEKLSSTTRLSLVLVLLLSLFVQLTTFTRTVVVAPLSTDAAEYFSYAWNLDHHGVYSRAKSWEDPAQAVVPDKVRPPGYPLFLLSVGEPQPNQAWAFRVGLLQALLSVASVFLSFVFARRVLPTGLAVAAAALVAINPFIAASAVYLLTETLFTFLLLAAVLLSLQALRGRAHWWWALAAGLCWGACSLVRPTTQFLPPLLFAAAFVLPRWRPWRRAAAFGLLGFALAMAPWLLRNLSVPPTPAVESLALNSLVHGSYPGFMYQDQPRSLGYPYRFDPAFGEKVQGLRPALSSLAREAAARPLAYGAWYLFGKPYFFLSLRDVQSEDIQLYTIARTPWYEDWRFETMAVLSRMLHWPLVLGALAAIVLLAWRPRLLRLAPDAQPAAAFLAVVIAYAIALHMVAAPFPRYSIPFRPLLFVLGLAAFHAGWLARRGARP